MKEEILIPTRGRVGKQSTYDFFSTEFIKEYNIRLVCSAEESKEHKKLGYDTLRCPVEGIGRKRQWIMERAKRKRIKRIIMCDDDVSTWSVRKSYKAWNLRRATQNEIENIFKRIFRMNEEYAMVGVSQRSGNNRFFPDSIRECVRQWVVQCIDVRIFFKIEAKFDTLQCMEDFNVILHFLRNGYKNVLLTDCAWDTISNAPGGCSIYRTEKIQRRYAKMLQKLHPKFVTVVKKKTKTGWKGMKERTDVRIQWKKAYESSKEKGKQDAEI